MEDDVLFIDNHSHFKVITSFVICRFPQASNWFFDQKGFLCYFACKIDYYGVTV